MRKKCVVIPQNTIYKLDLICFYTVYICNGTVVYIERVKLKPYFHSPQTKNQLRL